MNDVFLVLAQADGGMTCFVVPRVLDDGTRNRIDVVRLKDKLGNRSNASSELELAGTLAQRLGDEGRGVRTIIEMVAATRLDCVLGSAALMRHALAEASWHVAHRSAFGGLLVDKPLMQNVVADLAVESEAATALAMRLAAAVDRPGDPHEVALRRIALPLAKFWVCKRTPAMVAEALECLGGNGYVEDSGLPLMFRESPLNSIWEGSGNVNALDVLRALGPRAGGAAGLDHRGRRRPRGGQPAGPGGRRHARPPRRGRRARGRRAPTGRPDGRLPAGIAARAVRARRGRRRVLRQPVRDVVRRHVRDAGQRVAARGRGPGDTPCPWTTARGDATATIPAPPHAAWRTAEVLVQHQSAAASSPQARRDACVEVALAPTPVVGSTAPSDGHRAANGCASAELHVAGPDGLAAPDQPVWVMPVGRWGIDEDSPARCSAWGRCCGAPRTPVPR